MKILFILEEFPALSETFILNQITGLIDRGHELDIFAGHRGSCSVLHPDVERYGLLGATTYPVESLGPRQFLASLRAPSHSGGDSSTGVGLALGLIGQGVAERSVKLIRNGAALAPLGIHDIVHCHFGPSGVVGARLQAAHVLGGKLVTTFYGYDVTSFVRKKGVGVYRRLFSRGDLFLALSEVMKERLHELGCLRDRIVIHHLGVQLDRFPHTTHQSDEAEPLRLISVARLAEKKGLEYAIRAVARLEAAGKKVRLDIVGNGPRRESLNRLIRDLSIEESVHLLGWRSQPEVQVLLRQADILLAPSVTAVNGDQEGTPTVLLEAMATGLPIVATRHGGIPEQVIDGEQGYLVPERDVEALVERLSHLADHPSLRREMGDRGRRRVQEAFDMETLNDRLVQLYSKLLA